MPQIIRSLQSTWQTVRAYATDQIPVRDCQTQTFSQAELELALKQAAENAANHKRDPETSLSRKEIEREGDVYREAEASLKGTDSSTSQDRLKKQKPQNHMNATKDSSATPSLGDSNVPNDKNAKIKKVGKYAVGFTAVAALSGVGVFLAAPAALTAMGFTAAGISSGSIGAWMMSVSAVMSGGGVPAGGAVALLQSAGATGGFAASTCAAFGLGSAAVGTGLFAVGEVTVGAVRYITRPKNRNLKHAETQTDDDADAPTLMMEPLMGTNTSQDRQEELKQQNDMKATKDSSVTPSLGGQSGGASGGAAIGGYTTLIGRKTET